MDSRKEAGLEQIQHIASTMTGSLGAVVAPVANFSGVDTVKHKEKNGSKFGLFQDQRSPKPKTRNTRYLGPGGALGIGCGAGIGVAVTGGAGVGASPWNALKLVFGVGVGCGLGLGYGYGVGLGVRWDQRPKKNPSSKRIVIEI